MKFCPLHDRVVIKRIEAEAKTAGGIMQRITSIADPKAIEVEVTDLIDSRFVKKLDENGFIEAAYAA
jgi:co-chaperonin GroES (HSP10)